MQKLTLLFALLFFTSLAQAGSWMLLHGCDQTAQEFALGTRLKSTLESHGHLVLTPEQDSSLNPMQCWRWWGEAADKEKLLQQIALTPPPRYLVGISAGAGIALAMLLERPELFSAVALHSGPAFATAQSQWDALSVLKYGPFNEVYAIEEARKKTRESSHPVDVIIFHGTRDQVVNPRHARLIRKQLSVALPQSQVELIMVPHLAHAWAAGDSRFPYNAESDIDASEWIVETFTARSGR